MKLSPDDQFIPNKEKLRYLLGQYGHELVAYREANAGIENRTFIAQTSQGTLAVRAYRQRRKQYNATAAAI